MAADVHRFNFKWSIVENRSALYRIASRTTLIMVCSPGANFFPTFQDFGTLWQLIISASLTFGIRGRCVPVVRGAGVHQKGVVFCTEKLAENQWIHVFPEGKVTPTPIRIKWGIAHMIMESPNPPIVLPIWIQQMAEVWPLSKPYYPRFGKHVTITVGNEVDMKEHMWRFRTGSEIERRKAIADFVQKKLFDLGAKIATESCD